MVCRRVRVGLMLLQHPCQSLKHFSGHPWSRAADAVQRDGWESWRREYLCSEKKCRIAYSDEPFEGRDVQ